MSGLTCLVHFPGGAETVCQVDGDPLTRGNEVTIDGREGSWYVTRHSPTAEDVVHPFDVEIWVDDEAPPPPVDH